MTTLALRDHAAEILDAIALDLEAPQTRGEQSAKSKGHAPLAAGAPETAAQTHAVLRASDGFDIIQLVAEYRALRASVLRLWHDRVQRLESSFKDMVRFNEAIDQAVAESVGHFHALVETRRHLMLGMLSHDMRSPLNTVLTSAANLQSQFATDVSSEAMDAIVTRLKRGSTSLLAMLDDLVDYSAAKLGETAAPVLSAMDFGSVVHDEAEQMRAAYPAREIQIQISGSPRGNWDARLTPRLVRNLLGNAMRYGDAHAPVVVRVEGVGADVRLSVSNEGVPLEQSDLERMFDPFTRGQFNARARWRTRSGLVHRPRNRDGSRRVGHRLRRWGAHDVRGDVAHRTTCTGRGTVTARDVTANCAATASDTAKRRWP